MRSGAEQSQSGRTFKDYVVRGSDFRRFGVVFEVWGVATEEGKGCLELHGCAFLLCAGWDCELKRKASRLFLREEVVYRFSRQVPLVIVKPGVVKLTQAIKASCAQTLLYSLCDINVLFFLTYNRLYRRMYHCVCM